MDTAFKIIGEWRNETKKNREAPAKKKIKAKADKDFFKDTDIVKSVKGEKEIKILPLHKIAEIVFGNDPKK